MNFRESRLSHLPNEHPSDLFVGLLTASIVSVALWASLLAGYVLIG